MDIRSIHDVDCCCGYFGGNPANSHGSFQTGSFYGGNLAYGLAYFYEVAIQQGASYFFKQINMEKQVQDTDWVITGEGMYDAQSAAGKASYELLQLAKKHRKKTLLITAGDGGHNHVCHRRRNG